jgi:hypothetical protein
MFYLAFAKIVELLDLGNCPFPAQATEDGGSDHLLRIHLEWQLTLADFTLRMMQ